MIGLDANVLVRYLVQDDPSQFVKAKHIMEHELTKSDPGFVSLVSLAEMAWVLERNYGIEGPDIAAAIEQMLRTDSLLIQNEEQVLHRSPCANARARILL